MSREGAVTRSLTASERANTCVYVAAAISLACVPGLLVTDGRASTAPACTGVRIP